MFQANKYNFLLFHFARILGVQIVQPVHDDYRLDNRGTILRLPAGGRDFYLLQRVLTGAGVHLTSI